MTRVPIPYLNKDNLQQKKKALILCAPDAFANAVKPQKLKEHLESKNFNVQLVTSNGLSRLGDYGLKQKLPGFSFAHISLYILEAVFALSILTKNKFIISHVNSLIILPLYKKRGQLLHKKLGTYHADLIICENNTDIGFLAYPRIAKLQMLDLPAPNAEEIFYGGQITKNGFTKLKKYESELYAKADTLSFHWHTYTDFVKETKYNGKNIISLGYGTDSKQKTAHFEERPKIVFIGLLSGYWVNLPLLEKLCQLYPFIDVYGGPKPPEGLKINYKGYAPTLDVLTQYQFGLTTITDDPLRKNSFSSKHLAYISYGLPVLTPEWRKDSLLDDVSIYYNEKNFLTVIEKYSQKKQWETIHQRTLKKTKELQWKNIFKQFDTTIDKYL